MKAVFYNKYGDVDVLEFGDQPTPEPTDDEVLVKNYAAAFNPVDWKIFKGHLQKYAPKQFPAIVGFDGAGVVVKVGKNIKDFKAGDEVIYDSTNTPRGGSFAEFSAMPETMIAKKPGKMTFIEGASLGVPAYTANLGLLQAKAEKGQKLLVLGGSGAVGEAAVQIAKAYGLYVAATSTNVDLVKSIGADLVINYKQANWYDELKGQNYDIVYDTIGEQNGLQNSAQVLKKGGIYAFCSGQHGQAPADVVSSSVNAFAPVAGKHLATVAQLYEQGLYKPVIEKVYEFNLDKAKELATHSLAGKAKGRLVIQIIKQ